jgi:hypothetical protein
MKLSPLLFATALLATASVHAQTPLSPRTGATPYDFVAELATTGRSDIHEGSRLLGKTSTVAARASLVTTVAVDAQNQLLLGAGGQSLEFSAPAGSLVPKELTSAAFKLGWNRTIDPQWSVRLEADPGTYGAGSFGAPLALRAIYAASRDLQWALGVNYDWRSGHPLVGGVGVRWRFAPDWTLSLLVPAPRIEWAVSPELVLFAGANLRGGTFRVADDFGRSRGRPAFDRQVVDYREITIGVGARWQFTPTTGLNLGVGAATDRRFEFHDRNLLLNGDGAPAAQLTLTSAF